MRVLYKSEQFLIEKRVRETGDSVVFSSRAYPPKVTGGVRLKPLHFLHFLNAYFSSSSVHFILCFSFPHHFPPFLLSHSHPSSIPLRFQHKKDSQLFQSTVLILYNIHCSTNHLINMFFLIPLLLTQLLFQ